VTYENFLALDYRCKIIDANVCHVLGKTKVCKVTFLSLKSLDKKLKAT